MSYGNPKPSPSNNNKNDKNRNLIAYTPQPSLSPLEGKPK